MIKGSNDLDSSLVSNENFSDILWPRRKWGNWKLLVFGWNLGTICLYFEIGLKLAIFSCFTNAIASLPIALESCSRAQTGRPFFSSALEKSLVPGGCRFFVSDVISEVVFGSFWLMLPGVGPTARQKFFWPRNSAIPNQKSFSNANYKLCLVFWSFDWVCSAYRTR